MPARAQQEVLRLDVAVQVMSIVQRLEPSEQLIHDQQRGLEGEPSPAVLEQVLEVGSQQLEDHHIEVVLDTMPADLRKAHLSRQRCVDVHLLFKQRRMDGVVLELESHLFVCGNIAT